MQKKLVIPQANNFILTFLRKSKETISQSLAVYFLLVSLILYAIIYLVLFMSISHIEYISPFVIKYSHIDLIGSFLLLKTSFN